MKHSLLVTRTIVGAIGNAISVFLFVSPTPTFIRIYKKKSVEEFRPDPYLATTMNCLLWVFYGLPFVHPNSMLVVSTNGSGLAIQIVFLTIFCIYADKKGRLKVLCWAAAGASFMAIVTIVTILCFHTTQTRSFFVGILCVAFCLGMYISPLTVMRKVIKTNSVEYMPFWLSVGNLSNGVIWTIYAFLPFDQWMLIPNGIGAISGVVQLLLYGYYYKRTPKDSIDDDDDDDNEKKQSQVQMSSNYV